MGRNQDHFWLLIAGSVFPLLAWWVLSLFLGNDNSLFPTLFSAVSAVTRKFHGGQLLADVSSTLARAALGFALAVVSGIVAGAMLGSCRPARLLISPIVDFLRSIPVTTLYPIFILSLGIGGESKVGMIFYASTFVVVVSTMNAVVFLKRDRLNTMRLFGANRLELFWNVIIPEVTPSIFSGVKLALSFSLIVAILTEMFMGSESGIGQTIMVAYSNFNMPLLFGYVYLAGVIGLAGNVFLGWIEADVLSWAQVDD